MQVDRHNMPEASPQTLAPVEQPRFVVLLSAVCLLVTSCLLMAGCGDSSDSKSQAAAVDEGEGLVAGKVTGFGSVFVNGRQK